MFSVKNKLRERFGMEPEWFVHLAFRFGAKPFWPCSPMSSTMARNEKLLRTSSPVKRAVVFTYPFEPHFPPKVFANPKTLRHLDGYPQFSSSRRKSGPRLSACVPVESLGPGVRRDDGIMNEFNVMMDAQPTTKICESESASQARTMSATFSFKFANQLRIKRKAPISRGL